METISGRVTARFGKHRDGGATNVVEVKTVDTSNLTCLFPLVRKIPLLER